MKEVTLEIRWRELFGDKRSETDDTIRRQRWEEWKSLCLQQSDGKEVIEGWTDADECCTGCIHRDCDWCKYQQLPCTVNPILTFAEGIPGMACMGTGYQNSGQIEMF